MDKAPRMTFYRTGKQEASMKPPISYYFCKKKTILSLVKVKLSQIWLHFIWNSINMYDFEEVYYENIFPYKSNDTYWV